MTMLNIFLLVYWVGACYALGSATAAVLRGETGVLGIMHPNPPIWALVLEVIFAGLLSWMTVGFCHVQNAYRASGNPGLSCGIDKKH